MKIGHALAVAAVFTMLPADVWALEAQQSHQSRQARPVATPTPAPYRADAQTCALAGKALQVVQTAASQITSHGDVAQTYALAYTAATTISSEDSDKLLSACDGLSDGVNAMMTAVSGLDSVFPATDDLSLQLLHLKIGVAAEPLKPFGISLLQRMMATVNCDVGDAFAACQAKYVAPLFSATDASGAPTRPYADFRAKTLQALAALKTYLQTQVCADNPAPIAAVN